MFLTKTPVIKEAFFSGTDDSDDRSNIGFSGVLGKINDAVPATVWRFNYMSTKFEAKFEQIFTVPQEVLPEVPKEWMDKVTTPTYQSYQSHGGFTGQGGYQGNRGVAQGNNMGKSPSESAGDSKKWSGRASHLEQYQFQKGQNKQTTESPKSGLVNGSSILSAQLGFDSGGYGDYEGIWGYEGGDQGVFLGHHTETQSAKPASSVNLVPVTKDGVTMQVPVGSIVSSIVNGEEVLMRVGEGGVMTFHKDDPVLNPKEKSITIETGEDESKIIAYLENLNSKKAVSPVSKSEASKEQSSGQSESGDASLELEMEALVDRFSSMYGVEVAYDAALILTSITSLEEHDELLEEVINDAFGLLSYKGQERIFNHLVSCLPEQLRVKIETYGLSH